MKILLSYLLYDITSFIIYLFISSFSLYFLSNFQLLIEVCFSYIFNFLYSIIFWKFYIWLISQSLVSTKLLIKKLKLWWHDKWCFSSLFFLVQIVLQNFYIHVNCTPKFAHFVNCTSKTIGINILCKRFKRH